MKLNKLNKFEDFSPDIIPSYLNSNKEKLINMSISLDRFEISKSLTISLNRILLGTNIKLSDVYNSMESNFNTIEKKIISIEDKIKLFNSEQKYEYFVDPEKISYIVFYKQIVYVKKLIDTLVDYVNSNINLVFIHSYLISKLYNQPEQVSSNYIFIFNKIISSPSFLSNSNEKFNKIINSKVVDKIFIMIKIIYSGDEDFVKLLNNYENKKMEEYKKNNSIDHSDSFVELEKKVQNIKNDKINIGGGVDIYSIENNFVKMRDFMFEQKRKINIQELCKLDNLNLILDNDISMELWFGYNLFIYKRFDFNFEEYKTTINEILKSKNYDRGYMLNLNYLNDIDIPDAGILPIVGGSAIYNFNTEYYSKYVKYKNKYLKLKKIK